MKKTLTIFGFLLATSALFSQSISANFQTDMEGWASQFTGIFECRDTVIEMDEQLINTTTLTAPPLVEWSKLFAPMNDRGGISFSGKSLDRNLFLFVKNEVPNLLPNTNYRITFNTNWLAWLEVSASPIIVKVGALNEDPRLHIIGSRSVVEPETFNLTPRLIGKIAEGEDTISYRKESTIETRTALFDRGELGQDGRDFVVAGQLTPNENGLAFTQNINNFDNAFYVNTDDEGRLFLMIGIETENPKIENVFLNTVRIVLREVPEIQEVQEDEEETDDKSEAIDTNKNEVNG